MKLYPSVILTIAFTFATTYSWAETPTDKNEAVANSQTIDNYELAAKAFAENKPNDAFIYLKNALQQNPRHLPSKLLLSQVYFDAGNIPATEEELRESLDLGADINLVLPLLGHTLIMQRKVDALLALEQYSKDFNRQTQFEWALLKGQAYLIRKDQTMAQMQFENALAISPNDVRAINTMATLYLQLGWFDKAGNLITKSMDIDPKDEKTWVLKGELALAQGKLEDALIAFNQAFTIDSYDPRVLRNLATTNLKLKNIAQTQTYIDLILAQSPSDPAATLINAWLLMSDNQEALAQQSLADLSAKLSLLDESELSEDLSLLFVQSAAEYIQGNYEKARQHLEAYLAKAPTDIGAIRMLTDIYVKTNVPRKAAELLESKRSVISGDIELSAKLIQLYIADNKLLQAEQLLASMKMKLPDNIYLTYLEAQIEAARHRPKQALAILNRHQLGKDEPFRYSLLKGQLQLQLNDLKAAKATAERIIASKVDNNDALNFIAAVLIKNNQLDSALPYIDRALSTNNQDVSARFNKAIILKSQGKLSEAENMLNEILTQNKQHTPTLILLARNDTQAGKYENAISRINQILVYDPNNTSALETKLVIYKQQQNWKEALATAQQLNQLDRLNADYLTENIQLLIRLQRYGDTERYQKILFGLWSNEPEQLRFLAQLQVSSRHLEAAIQTLQKAADLNSKSLPIQLELSQLYFISGNTQAAQQQLESAEAKFGKTANIYLLRGDIAQREKQLESARQQYLAALNLDADNTTAIINLYQLTLKGVGATEFTTMLETRVKDADAPHWMRKLLADSYLNQGNFAAAQKHYERLIAIPELANDSSILNNLANIYSATDLSKALKTAQKGLESDKKNPALLDTLGWILARQGQFNDALPYLREAYSFNASNHEVRYHIGYTLLKLDRKTEAIAELKAAVDGGPTFAEYNAAKALLDSIQ